MKITSDVTIYDVAKALNLSPSTVSRVIQPCLTTVDYPAREIGRLAASSLINILKDKGSTSLSAIIVKHELNIWESSLRKKVPETIKT